MFVGYIHSQIEEITLYSKTVKQRKSILKGRSLTWQVFH